MTFLVILAKIYPIFGLYEVFKGGRKTLYTALVDIFFTQSELLSHKIWGNRNGTKTAIGVGNMNV